ncbi:hypothetical protein GCM10011571_11770 [Marinithermofilum abyssi]|uniref:Uncharacterized protein n=1 Tax=Marinithermofilum abyssi TaxID=1571185 RepID=A0A8J2VEM3_9BACL|nr:hypothetical protein [Marinithermofilum abyssi]GGE12037.1 hypothetical protein GCM10011571_11770 [Marinithermofilum abyssi]
MDRVALERMLILFVSLAFLMIFIQVTMYHYRQNFQRIDPHEELVEAWRQE